jgi:Domain of unknown function (DUF4249)
MNRTSLQILISLLFLLNSCITQFIPQTRESNELLVVEGLITDQPGPYTIKLSGTMPLGTRSAAKPATGYNVSVTDDFGNRYQFKETDTGTYVSDSSRFKGMVGRFYTLHLNTNKPLNSHKYESYSMEMIAVPPIDSLYYEKVKIFESFWWSYQPEGCQIYLNTYDPTSKCRYFRWEFIETWEFRLPYTVPNNTCWATGYSVNINVKNTTSFSESRILKYPLNFISNLTDRLKFKYSMSVYQYSITEDEYNYWDKLQNVSEQVGGLYDIIPASIENNVYCIDDPDKKVLGYFSVSASSSRRIFIKDYFKGIFNLYTADACVADTIWGDTYIPNLGASVWVIIDNFSPRYKVITYSRWCADCTTRGTTQKPSFWKDYK